MDRGLSPKGNKSTLITRIQAHDQHKTLQAVSVQDPPQPPGAQVRHASLVAPTASGSVPGIPPAAQPTSHLAPTAFTNINLPDLSQPDPEIPTPIPFYPDSYDSIYHPNPYTSADPLPPKVLVVAGSSTHHGGGPSHNAFDGPESLDRHEYEPPLSSSSSVTASAISSAGVWQDVADDIGLSGLWNRGQVAGGRKAVLDSLLEKTGTSNAREKDHSRKLDRDEVKGVWVLVGLLAGSWVVGGLVNSPPKDEHGEKPTH